MTRQTKLAKLKQLWTARQYDAALALVASFPRQGAAKGPVGRARAAALSPGMYAEMGHDVAALRVVALHAIATQWGLTKPELDNG